jgi:L-2-hydroxyglutarate oxidase LhgO
MPAAPPPRADRVVVGAGILGLATAAELLRREPGRSVVVLEKESGPAEHQTGRNSCVIHSGVYYTAGSLKAELCAAGRRQLLAFCDEHGVPYEICGKVIVAAETGELPRLEELHRRGTANGVSGLRLIGPEELRELEPHCVGVRALAVPEAGLVDYRAVAAALHRLVENRGGTVVFDSRVTELRPRPGGLIVASLQGELETSFAVACAGLHSDRLIADEDDDDTIVVPFRGDYFALREDARHLCRNLIYPVPDPAFPFLGIHATRRPDGAVWTGPNAVLALAREGYRRRDVHPREAAQILTAGPLWRLARRYWRIGAAELYRDVVKSAFAAAVRRYLPEVERHHLLPAPAGVRAQALRADGTLADDFVFVEAERVLHVKSAPSPAATSALAIASMIADRALAASPA